MPETIRLVVPCFDEARRLPVDAFREGLERHRDLALLFVDDGSRDATRSVLDGLREGFESRVDVLPLPENRGKGEAVRAGLLRALSGDAPFTGYWDADLSTPLSTAFEMAVALEREPALVLVMGSREGRRGADIRRLAIRHYPGRLLARRISRALGLAVRDTQCGAKVLRRSPLWAQVVKEPFETRWLFDVEILARLTRLHAAGSCPPVASIVREFPLAAWTHVAGSKVRALDFVRAWKAVRRIARP